MKKGKLICGMASILGAMLVSCSEISDFERPVADEGQQEGLLTLSLSSNTKFAGSTRAVTESSYTNVENYTVVVTDKDGVEKMRCNGSEVASKMPLTLSLGSYSVQAFYGTEHAYSRNEFYVFGETYGTITENKTETAEVVCTPTCGRIAVNFDDTMADYYSDYNVTFTGTEAMGTESISWLKGDSEPWYVKLKEEGETITFAINTTVKDEYVNNEQQGDVKKGTFKLNRNKAYKMNISANYTPTDLGDIKITITIDERTNDKPVDIEVPIEWTR